MKNENGKWKIEMSTKKTKKAALSLMIRVLITLVLRLLYLNFTTIEWYIYIYIRYGE